MKKIALEEHIGTPELIRLRYETPLGKQLTFPGNPDMMKKLLDISCDVEQIRIPQMDQNGIDMQFLMSVSLGITYLEDAKEALREAAAFNDFMAKEVVQKHPDRFRAFASIPLQDPDLAAKELRRCVTEYGFVGAMIVGKSVTSDFLDDPSFDVLWEAAQDLDAVLYIHPGETMKEATYMYQGFEVMNGSTWSWGVDTSTLVLRMIFAGIFDRYPGLKLMMGHMGEMLPFVFDRTDIHWELFPMDAKNKKRPSEYFRKNIYVSVSGNPSSQALRCTIDTMGADRVFFAVDYPFEKNELFTSFIENADLTEEERELICYRNAEKLFRL